MRKLTLLAFIGLLAAAALLREIHEPSARDGIAEPKTKLVMYCAASMQEVMTAVARDYQSETGVEIGLVFGGSGALKEQLKIAGGDLYLPADESYLESLKSRIVASVPLLELRPGLVVPAGNPQKLTSVQDIINQGASVGIANESASIGKLTWEILEEAGLREEFEARCEVGGSTVTGILIDVVLLAVDCAFIWDTSAAGWKQVEWVELPLFASHTKVASLAVLAGEQQAQALRFLEFVQSEPAQKCFRAIGKAAGRK